MYSIREGDKTQDVKKGSAGASRSMAGASRKEGKDE
jgi:hypothetical protein